MESFWSEDEQPNTYVRFYVMRKLASWKEGDPVLTGKFSLGRPGHRLEDFEQLLYLQATRSFTRKELPKRQSRRTAAHLAHCILELCTLFNIPFQGDHVQEIEHQTECSKNATLEYIGHDGTASTGYEYHFKFFCEHEERRVSKFPQDFTPGQLRIQVVWDECYTERRCHPLSVPQVISTYVISFPRYWKMVACVLLECVAQNIPCLVPVWTLLRSYLIGDFAQIQECL